ncbi:MAG: GntR family transcriptional regulator [Streptosporangiaceae bacterium]
MTDVDPIGNPDYTYVQVANVIAARIASGEFTSRLPAERDLADRFGVSYQTVRHGMGLLRDRGLVITRHGRGNFVMSNDGPDLPG